MSEQVGNAQVAPESTNVQDAVMSNSSDFFESLDREVNGGILDEQQQPRYKAVTRSRALM